MAKVKYLNINGIYDPNVELNFTAGQLALVDDRKQAAGYVDQDTGFQVYLFGKGFQYEENQLLGGKVETVQILNVEGEVFVEIKNFNLAANTMHNLLLEDFSFFFPKLLQHNDVISGTGLGDFLVGEVGNDIIKARGGADVIVGATGNDTMSGGAGGDQFQFFAGIGKDVITDFTIGDGEDSDQLLIREDGFQMVSFKKQLMFEFENGSSLLLKDVAFADRTEVQIDAIL